MAKFKKGVLKQRISLLLLFALTVLIGIFIYYYQLHKEIEKSDASAQTGQIIVDLEHPGRMIYKGVYVSGKPKPVILCGPGDPEDFFYNDTQNNMQLLIDRQANTNYIQAYHSDFCKEEDKNCFPGEHINFDEQLDQWEDLITQMEAKNIATVFFIFDDHYIPLEGWDNFDWQTPVGKMVEKFKHHKLFIWVVAEEYSEGPGFDRTKEIAEFIKANDENNHIVGVHQLPNYWPDLESGWKFDFKDVPAVDMFLMQYNDDEVWKMYNRVYKAWNYVSGNKIVNMAENIYHAEDSRAVVRKRNWASIMGGASMVMVHEMGRKSDPPEWNFQVKYTDCEVLTNFFESTSINEMIPDKVNNYGKTLYLLSNTPYSYIAYGIGVGSTQAEGLGISNMKAGKYLLKWLEIPTGNIVGPTTQDISTGNNLFKRPASFTSGEVASYINQISLQPTSVLSPPVFITNTPTPGPTRFLISSPTPRSR